MELRPHQIEALDAIRVSMKTHRSVILRAPTGFGKTIVGAKIVEAAANKGSSVIFTVHRRELLKQTMATFDALGIDYGVISAGYKYDPFKQVNIASIDTLKRRLEIIPEPDLLMPDEVHHCVSEGWAKVLNHYDECKILGLTATPCRLDGRGLGELFQDMVHGKDTDWLIENKFLSAFRAFIPSVPDLSGVHMKGGDYDLHETEKKMDEPTITGDAVQHYKDICPNSRAIAFCTTISHAKHVADSFNEGGIVASSIDGEMNISDRDAVIEKFRNNEIKVLTNCNIVSEGFDVPAMDAAILLRPTKSLSLYLQQVGRSLRYVEGKTAIILDHAGNILEHGLPTDKFDWSLEGRKGKKKSKQEVSVRRCIKCYYANEARAEKCACCGFVFEVKERVVAQVAGTLSEIDINTWRKKAPYKEVVRKSKTYTELLEVAKARGYKKGWATKILQERMRNERGGFNAASGTGGI